MNIYHEDRIFRCLLSLPPYESVRVEDGADLHDNHGSQDKR